MATASILRRSLSSTASSSLLAGRTIVICGGGVIGLASAVHLAREGLGDKVVVIERDASYKYCSALLSAGGIRHQFSLPENILMSKYSSDFILDYASRSCSIATNQHKQAKLKGGVNTGVQGHEEDHEDGIAFKPHGYLFLAKTEDQQRILQSNNKTQRSCGVDWVHTADANQLDEIYPWLNTEDLIGGSYSHKDQGTKEGYFDPWGLMQCMKREAIRNNVHFIEGQIDKVQCVNNNSSRVGEPLLTANSIHFRRGKSDSNEVEEIHGLDAIINATGAWSHDFVNQTICNQNASLLSPTQQEDILNWIPIERRKRCIFYVHCPGKHKFSHPVPPTTTPLTIDPSGVYFRAEGSSPGSFICGVSPEASSDPACSSDAALESVDHSLFEEKIWPTLAHRVPAFNELKVKSEWSGFYDYNTVDQNAIIGYHPNFTNMICAGGFSGHGLQMSPAAGNAVAELLLYKEFRSIDLQAFSFDRLDGGEATFETGIV